MKTASLAKVRASFSQYVSDVVRTRERVTITRNGEPAVVLISADDLECLEETLFWVQNAEPALPGDASVVDGKVMLQDTLARAEAVGETATAQRMRTLLDGG